MPTPSSPPPGPDPDTGPRERSSAVGSWSRTAGLGMSFAMTIGIFAWAGYALDARLGTSPGFLIAGVFLGFVGALISMVKKLPPSRGARHPRSDSDTDR